MPKKEVVCSKCRGPKLLKKIEDNSEKKFSEISKVLDIKKNYDIKLKKENQEIIISEEDKKILSGNFKFFGIIKNDGTFYWSYMIPGVDKRIINYIDKIKSMSHIFQNSDDPDMLLFHRILTQDTINLEEDEIGKLNDLLLYLSDSLYFFNTIHKSGNLQLIYLTSINEKFI